MRINMPLTNNEIILKKGDILVSRTDLMGRITYVNDAFVEVSGFSRNELVGAEHNIIRHPDMPAAAFEDMWDTLKKVRPWQGLVKNRSKNGDFYWVSANAMPLFKNGKVYEYLSVRHPLKRTNDAELLRKTESLYNDLNTGKATLKLTGLPLLWKYISEISINKKTAISVSTFLAPIMFFMYRLLLAHEYELLAGIGLLAIIGSAVSINTTKTITKTLEVAIRIFYSLGEGGFGSRLDLKRNDQLGDLLRGIYCMEVKLGVDLADVRQEASKSKRITQALDNVQSGVMVANNNFEIIYTNHSVERMFKEAEQDIRRQLPNFDANKLLGANIDIFHKDPSSQRHMLENLKESYRSELFISSQHMNVIISPVLGDNGERIGYVAEWKNKTHEVLIENEIDKLVQSVKSGDFSTRLKLTDKSGFTKTLSTSINELTDVIESVFVDVNRVMESMADGDLTSSITNEYQGVYAECKNNINGTLTKLSEFIIQIRDASDFIDSSSQEIASGNHNLSHRVEQQAANLEETAASMEELASTVKNNYDNTVQANEVVNSASKLAQKGGDVVKSAIEAMHEINESSNKIAEIIEVIDEIAFQTNLLALNASVEAARAGEHGRGFSVVATEVRNLAQRSAIAAKQSNDLIQNSVRKVRAGTDFVNETGAALTEIVDSVAKVGQIVSQIASAGAEQTAGINLVNQAVSQMDDITQQNAALAEQAATGSIAMSEQATSMTQLLSFFRVNGRAPVARIANIKTMPKKILQKPNRNDEWEEF